MRLINKSVAIIMCIFIAVCSLVPVTANAKVSNSKVVRVGWYDSTYNTVDKTGFRSGYAYEYQLKLSSYNGWSYEYVEGSWPELLHMLEMGEIDLMSDVSYTPEREKNMLYSSLPMGTEEYYLFTASGNNEISPAKKSSLNGKKVGVNESSIQADFYKEWEKENGVNSDIVYVSCSEEESLQMLDCGELDAYVTVDSFVEPSRAVPVFKIGSSDYYFAVTKKRPDLLEELDYAMSRIQDENRFYNMELFERFIRRTGANATLSSDETGWLSEHGKIRVGYQDNYLAFCTTDKKTGKLTGVIKDYLEEASSCLQNVNIDFEAKGYPTVKDAIDALEKGEIDCVFPANLSGYDAEKLGTVMTPPIVSTEMYAAVSNKSPHLFSKRGKIRVAVNQGNLNYDAFLSQYYPDWERVYYKNTDECLKAVSRGRADCFIISNYRLNNIERLCDRLRLTTFSLGVEMNYCFAIEKGNTELYSVMSKVIGMIPDAFVIASFSQYLTEDAKQVSINDFIRNNALWVIAFASVIIMIILVLLFMNMRAVKKARKLIAETETDDLTGLYTRKYFFKYAEIMQRENPDIAFDAIVLNIEQFHSVNELYGRTIGDRVLRALGNEIGAVAKENKGIAGRFEADRFDIFCRHIDDYHAVYDRLQASLNNQLPNIDIRLRVGIMPWQENLDSEQLFDRARIASNLARGSYNKQLFIYDEIVSGRESFEQRLTNDLRRGIENCEFEVYYQPKYNIEAENPEIVSAEALVRWNHPEFGMVMPSDFIPLFERNGQITQLDKYVWSKAAEQIVEWKKEYGVTIPVSVNLSRVDVFDTELEATLTEILNRNNLDYNNLTLEITESAYAENTEQIVQAMDNLRKIGFRIEMDDFGSGYSSLNMLSSMGVDVVKMDREFVLNIEKEEKSLHLVELIIDIAKNINVPVIAEGVENENQLRLLKELGCNMVQGYYFSRPLPADKFSSRFLS